MSSQCTGAPSTIMEIEKQYTVNRSFHTYKTAIGCEIQWKRRQKKKKNHQPKNNPVRMLRKKYAKSLRGRLLKIPKAHKSRLEQM